MKINLLSPKIYNRIAAGEVVDRPRSVVKELFENSVDAGATSVVIEIQRGGLELIRVTDDGHGIERGEMGKVFLAHATSKISDISDLSHISTLGFRGEAIASIASVSRVTVTSRTLDDELGYYMAYENGEKADEGERGCAVGTTVTVEGLFRNVPARAKFLKAPKSEEADIATLVSKLILTSPDVSIKLICDGKTVYSSSGEGLEAAVICVYGREMLDNLMPVSLSEPDVSISGYVNKPAFSKHNKSYQTIALNGRYILNDEIGYAVFYSFKDYLMTRQYPMFILSVRIPEDMVDVNVHPGKMEVKFVQPERIRKLIKQAIDERIREHLSIPKTIVKPKADADEDIFSEDPIELTSNNKSQDSLADETALTAKSARVYTTPASGTGKMEIRESAFSSLIREIKPINAGRYNYNDASANEAASTVKSTETKLIEFTQASFEEEAAKREDWSAVTRVVGRVFSTYLLLQTDNELLLIDQHAAHERILFDRLKASIDSSKEIQPLLLPYIFETTYGETELIEKCRGEIEACGFELDTLSGNSFCLRGVPACLSEMNLKGFVGDLLYNLKMGRLSKTDFIKSTVMQCACKAAVKGQTDLSEPDIAYIIEKLGETRELFCPHGRPIVIRITRAELEKWFKRIV